MRQALPPEDSGSICLSSSVPEILDNHSWPQLASMVPSSPHCDLSPTQQQTNFFFFPSQARCTWGHRPGTEPMLQQQPEPLQGQCWIPCTTRELPDQSFHTHEANHNTAHKSAAAFRRTENKASSPLMTGKAGAARSGPRASQVWSLSILPTGHPSPAPHTRPVASGLKALLCPHV